MIINDVYDKMIKNINSRANMIGIMTRNMMVQRIQRGFDKDGQPFKDYTDKYKRFKAGSGRVISPVNLTFRFKMLRAISSKAIEGGFELFFSSYKEALKAQGNIDKGRDFWGLTSREYDFVVDKFNKSIEEALR